MWSQSTANVLSVSRLHGAAEAIERTLKMEWKLGALSACRATEAPMLIWRGLTLSGQELPSRMRHMGG